MSMNSPVAIAGWDAVKPIASKKATPKKEKSAASQQPWLVIGFVGLCVVAAGSVVVSQWRASTPAAATVTYSYYSTDGGKTVFAADAAKGMAFDKDGQAAIQAVVFSVDNNKTHFVGYLKRINAKITQSSAVGAVPAAGGIAYEVKRPGSSAWVPRYSPQGFAAIAAKAPTGSGQPVEVTPQSLDQ